MDPIRNDICLINKSSEYIKNNVDNKLWYLLKSSSVKDQDYILNEKDIIRFGQKKYQVIKININVFNVFNVFNDFNDDINKIDNSNDYNINNINKKKWNLFNIDIRKDKYKIITEGEINKKRMIKLKNRKNNNFGSTKGFSDKELTLENEQCRICSEIDSTKENPKLLLCNCKSYTHFECIKGFLNKKIDKIQNLKGNVLTYICKAFNCGVCKSPYPLRFRIPEFDKIYELIDLNLPNKDKNYIILDSLDYIHSDKNEKTVHIVKLKDEEEIQIGRGDNYDIYEEDESISRPHARLSYNNKVGGFLLKDANSAFGTMVLIKDNIIVEENVKEFQVANCKINMKLINKNE